MTHREPTKFYVVRVKYSFGLALHGSRWLLLQASFSFCPIGVGHPLSTRNIVQFPAMFTGWLHSFLSGIAGGQPFAVYSFSGDIGPFSPRLSFLFAPVHSSLVSVCRYSIRHGARRRRVFASSSFLSVTLLRIVIIWLQAIFFLHMTFVCRRRIIGNLFPRVSTASRHGRSPPSRSSLGDGPPPVSWWGAAGPGCVCVCGVFGLAGSVLRWGPFAFGGCGPWGLCRCWFRGGRGGCGGVVGCCGGG